MNTPENTALAHGTSEAVGFPALILGLDGWLLRAIPAEHRNQFLDQYHKVLKTIFHPDRIQDDFSKRGREKFLQIASESIAFLKENPINFELSVDAVPTRFNPVVKLGNKINTLESVILRKEIEHADMVSKLESQRQDHLQINQRYTEIKARMASIIKIFRLTGSRPNHALVPLFDQNLKWIEMTLKPAVIGAGNRLKGGHEDLQVVVTSGSFNIDTITYKVIGAIQVSAMSHIIKIGASIVSDYVGRPIKSWDELICLKTLSSLHAAKGMALITAVEDKVYFFLIKGTSGDTTKKLILSHRNYVKNLNRRWSEKVELLTRKLKNIQKDHEEPLREINDTRERRDQKRVALGDKRNARQGAHPLHRGCEGTGPGCPARRGKPVAGAGLAEQLQAPAHASGPEQLGE
jgi:hypothetical protein